MACHISADGSDASGLVCAARFALWPGLTGGRARHPTEYEDETMRRTPKILLSAAMLAALATSGCSRLRTHEGFVIDTVLLDSVAVGIDNKASVERTLGRPTFSGQFGDSDWYYLSRESRSLAFANPRPRDQNLIHIRFDAAGNVTAVNRSGIETIARVSPNGDSTPTLGRQRSFFEDIFGNIGTVGAPGSTTAGGGRGGQ
jgi:outer membrane protein assembly factor BamE (lipoprotein component of BamABCDE complex)